jgi:predicted nuclease of predicted toxin-antitoxin system
VKLLVDMNLSPDWTARLAAAGIEAVHWASVGHPTASDEEILGSA